MLPLKQTFSFDGSCGLPGAALGELLSMVHARMSFESPHFGYVLFYVKCVAPPAITMAQIGGSSTPCLVLQATEPAICIVFPEFLLWLPRPV